MKNDTEYVAVVGDAIASRALEPAERNALQRGLRSALGKANRRWASAIAARFAIALGDQFEGLLADSRAIWDVTHFLRAELRGVDWVVACGRGTITTPLGATAPEVDGPCFHRAREALEQAKKETLVLTFAGFSGEVAGFARYYSALYWSWTGRQREVASLLRVVEPAAAAERLGVDRSAVSHIASRMSWPLVVAGDAAFRRSMEMQ